MVVGGEEEFLGLFGRSFEREGREIVFFMLEHIYNMQISLSGLISLSENLLLALSATFHNECNFS